MADVNVSVSEFRTKFIIFSSSNKYPDDVIQNMLDTSKLYISPAKNCLVPEDVQKQMIYLLTAHMLEQQNQMLSGNGGVAGLQLSSASVDGVSVGIAIPQSRSELDYWLNTTMYGRQLLALLSMLSGIGVYIGGQRENVFR